MGLPVWLMLDLEETCEELIITQMINNFVNELLSVLKNYISQEDPNMISNKLGKEIC